MTDNKTIQPDPVLMNRLHEACMPWLKHRGQSAFRFSSRSQAAMDHVLESPDNAAPREAKRRAKDYEPDKA